MPLKTPKNYSVSQVASKAPTRSRIPSAGVGGNIVSSIAVRKERDTSGKTEKYVEKVEGEKLVASGRALQGVVERVMQTGGSKDVKRAKPVSKTVAQKQADEDNLASRTLANVQGTKVPPEKDNYSDDNDSESEKSLNDMELELREAEIEYKKQLQHDFSIMTAEDANVVNIDEHMKFLRFEFLNNQEEIKSKYLGNSYNPQINYDDDIGGGMLMMDIMEAREQASKKQKELSYNEQVDSDNYAGNDEDACPNLENEAEYDVEFDNEDEDEDDDDEDENVCLSPQQIASPKNRSFSPQALDRSQRSYGSPKIASPCPVSPQYISPPSPRSATPSPPSPRVTSPCPVTPRSATPRSATPRSATPRSATPGPVSPRSPIPSRARSPSPEKAVAPKDLGETESCLAVNVEELDYDQLYAQYQAEQLRRNREYNLEKLELARERGLQKREGVMGIQKSEVQGLSPQSRQRLVERKEALDRYNAEYLEKMRQIGQAKLQGQSLGRQELAMVPSGPDLSPNSLAERKRKILEYNAEQMRKCAEKGQAKREGISMIPKPGLPKPKSWKDMSPGSRAVATERKRKIDAYQEEKMQKMREMGQAKLISGGDSLTSVRSVTFKATVSVKELSPESKIARQVQYEKFQRIHEEKIKEAAERGRAKLVGESSIPKPSSVISLADLSPKSRASRIERQKLIDEDHRRRMEKAKEMGQLRLAGTSIPKSAGITPKQLSPSSRAQLEARLETIQAARDEQYEKAKKMGEMRKSGIPFPTSTTSIKPKALSPRSRAAMEARKSKIEADREAKFEAAKQMGELKRAGKSLPRPASLANIPKPLSPRSRAMMEDRASVIEAARLEQYNKAKKMGEMKLAGQTIGRRHSVDPKALSPKSRAAMEARMGTIEAARQEQFEKARKLGEMKKSGIEIPTTRQKMQPKALSPKSRRAISERKTKIDAAREEQFRKAQEMGKARRDGSVTTIKTTKSQISALALSPKSKRTLLEKKQKIEAMREEKFEKAKELGRLKREGKSIVRSKSVPAKTALDPRQQKQMIEFRKKMDRENREKIAKAAEMGQKRIRAASCPRPKGVQLPAREAPSASSVTGKELMTDVKKRMIEFQRQRADKEKRVAESKALLALKPPPQKRAAADKPLNREELLAKKEMFLKGLQGTKSGRSITSAASRTEMVAQRQKEAAQILDKIRSLKMRESIGAPIDYRKKMKTVPGTPSAASIRAEQAALRKQQVDERRKQADEARALAAREKIDKKSKSGVPPSRPPVKGSRGICKPISQTSTATSSRQVSKPPSQTSSAASVQRPTTTVRKVLTKGEAETRRRIEAKKLEAIRVAAAKGAEKKRISAQPKIAKVSDESLALESADLDLLTAGERCQVLEKMDNYNKSKAIGPCGKTKKKAVKIKTGISGMSGMSGVEFEDYDPLQDTDMPKVIRPKRYGKDTTKPKKILEWEIPESTKNIQNLCKEMRTKLEDMQKCTKSTQDVVANLKTIAKEKVHDKLAEVEKTKSAGTKAKSETIADFREKYGIKDDSSKKSKLLALVKGFNQEAKEDRQFKVNMELAESGIKKMPRSMILRPGTRKGKSFIVHTPKKRDIGKYFKKQEVSPLLEDSFIEADAPCEEKLTTMREDHLRKHKERMAVEKHYQEKMRDRRKQIEARIPLTEEQRQDQRNKIVDSMKMFMTRVPETMPEMIDPNLVSKLMNLEERGISLHGAPRDVIPRFIASEDPKIDVTGLEKTTYGAIVPSAIPTNKINILNATDLENTEYALRNLQIPIPSDNIATEELENIDLNAETIIELGISPITSGLIEYPVKLDSYKVENFFQMRGSTLPEWFPGFFTAFPGDGSPVQQAKQPGNAILTAWIKMQPFSTVA